MELQAHFHRIPLVIIEHLGVAQSEILAAVAWFTDRDIFDVLCRRAQAGVEVSIAVLGDHINTAPGALNFQRLRNLGGNVSFLPPGSDGEPMMHHKFSVIDRVTVITGSYNWSKKAQRNDENITVATQAPEFAARYRNAFHDLLARTGQAAPEANLGINADVVRRRLETIRNLILLGEQETLPAHLNRLGPMSQTAELPPIMQALHQGNYTYALELIERHLQRPTSIALHEDGDVPRLQLQLQELELRLESLSEEKTDLERDLVLFNRSYSDALGDLLLQVLEAQAELAQHEAAASHNRAAEGETSRQEAEQDARRAEQARRDWQNYRYEHIEQQASAAPRRLTMQQEAELKQLYRRACSLCHPDRFSHDQKADAHRAFVELQEIYKANDLQALRELHETLKAGRLPRSPRSSTLSRADSLRVAIAELRNRITETLRQVKILHESEAAVLMRNAGKGQANWNAFFGQQKLLLQAEIERLQKELAAFDCKS